MPILGGSFFTNEGQILGRSPDFSCRLSLFMNIPAMPPRATGAGSEGGTAMAEALLETLADRYDYGTRLRKKTPREQHADLRGPAKRDPVAILAAGDRTRVPQLVPERYKRMLVSP